MSHAEEPFACNPDSCLPLAAALVLHFLNSGAVAAANAQAPEGVFAVVQGEAISDAEFNAHLVRYARSKLYHAISEDDLRALWQDAADDLIQYRLLVQEADRRGLSGDAESVERDLEAYEARYKDTAIGRASKRGLPGIRQKLLESTKIDALKAALRAVDSPDESQLKAFYNSHLESFTEPARIDLSTILMPVPSLRDLRSLGGREGKGRKPQAPDPRGNAFRGDRRRALKARICRARGACRDHSRRNADRHSAESRGCLAAWRNLGPGSPAGRLCAVPGEQPAAREASPPFRCERACGSALFARGGPRPDGAGFCKS